MPLLTYLKKQKFSIPLIDLLTKSHLNIFKNHTCFYRDSGIRNNSEFSNSENRAIR